MIPLRTHNATIAIIDSPPVQLVSDSVILAGLANALIFVVRADATPYQVAKGALEILKKAKAHLLGVVLNRLDVEKAGLSNTHRRPCGYCV